MPRIPFLMLTGWEIIFAGCSLKRMNLDNIQWRKERHKDCPLIELDRRLEHEIAVYQCICELEKKIMNKRNYENEAIELVKNYVKNHLDKSDGEIEFEVFTVWKCKILQNWKFLISTSLPDGMYYELTHNGDKNEWYLDVYKKFENICYCYEGEEN